MAHCDLTLLSLLVLPAGGGGGVVLAGVVSKLGPDTSGLAGDWCMLVGVGLGGVTLGMIV